MASVEIPSSIFQQLFGSSEQKSKSTDDELLQRSDTQATPEKLRLSFVGSGGSETPLLGNNGFLSKMGLSGHEAFLGFDGMIQFRPKGEAVPAFLGSHQFLNDSGIITQGRNRQAETEQAEAEHQAHQANLMTLANAADQPGGARQMAGGVGLGEPAGVAQQGQGSLRRPNRRNLVSWTFRTLR